MNLKIYSSQLENGIAIEEENGNLLEAVVTHLPGEAPSFTLANVQFNGDEEPVVTTLFSCPISAA